MNISSHHRGGAVHNPVDFVFQAIKALLLITLFLASMWVLFSSSEATAQPLLWNGVEDCSQKASFEDRMDCKLDTNKATLDLILGEVEDAFFEISAELCMEIAPATIAANVGAMASIEVNAEGGGGLNFYGEKIVANAAGAAGYEAGYGYEPSFTLASLTVCGSPAPIQLDAANADLNFKQMNSVAEFLTAYENEFSGVMSETKNLIPDSGTLMPIYASVLSLPPVPTDISDVFNSDPTNALNIGMANMLSLMKLPASITDLIKDPTSALDQIDICSYKDSFPASEAKTVLIDICATIHSAVGLDLLISPVVALPTEVGKVLTDISNAVTTINTNVDAENLLVRQKVGSEATAIINRINNRADFVKNAICGPAGGPCAPSRDDDGEEDLLETLDPILIDLTDEGEFDFQAGTGEIGLGEDIQIQSTPQLPTDYSLNVNYPNPFNPETIITFALPKNETAKIEVFDVMGRRVVTLLDRAMSAGYHQIKWDASRMPSGTYFYKLTAGGYTNTRQMMLTK